MKISVIVPVYNCESYLPACLDSILNQTFSDLEIIVVDDGSTDGSSAICDAYAQKDTRIQVIHQSNQGVSAARNVGLDIATGEYLSFIDSDDALDPEMYKILIDLSEAHHADIAHCGYRRFRLDGSTVDISGSGKLYEQKPEEALRCLITGQLFVGGLWNKLYRQCLFSDIRFDPDLKINEDVLVNYLAFRKAHHTVFLDKPLYHYYERVGSACNQTAQKKKLLDCAKATGQIYEGCLGTELQNAAAERYFVSLTGIYRFYVFDSMNRSRSQRLSLHHTIKNIGARNSISRRQRLNYMAMHFFPRMYRILYRLYDTIRVPNWDVKSI